MVNPSLKLSVLSMDTKAWRTWFPAKCRYCTRRVGVPLATFAPEVQFTVIVYAPVVVPAMLLPHCKCDQNSDHPTNSPIKWLIQHNSLQKQPDEISAGGQPSRLRYSEEATISVFLAG
jgi:hypothetical protein